MSRERAKRQSIFSVLKWKGRRLHVATSIAHLGQSIEQSRQKFTLFSARERLISEIPWMSRTVRVPTVGGVIRLKAPAEREEKYLFERRP